VTANYHIIHIIPDGRNVCGWGRAWNGGTTIQEKWSSHPAGRSEAADLEVFANGPLTDRISVNFRNSMTHPATCILPTCTVLLPNFGGNAVAVGRGIAGFLPFSTFAEMPLQLGRGR
jgi:hypothetical protein